ncbi:MAG: carboxypeptidase regulatory-like domain-containing protein [Vulcanimicrobiota bacterium]
MLAGYRLIFALKHGYDPYVDLILVTAAETLNHDIKMTPIWDTGQVKGFVTDFDSGAPLENVNVAIGSTKALTDAGGYFELDGIKAGTRNIVASKTGYAGYTGSVVVPSDAAVTSSFSMTPNTPAAIVSGNYELAGVQPGNREFTATMAGYADVTATLKVQPGETVTHDVQMTPLKKGGRLRSAWTLTVP